MNSTLVLAAASIALALAFRSQTGAYPEVAQRLPVLLIWVLVGLALLMIAEAVLRHRQARQVQEPAPREPASGAAALPDRLLASDEEPLPPVNWPVVLGFAAAIAAYAALIPIVGYLVTTTVFIGGALLASRVVRPLSAILVALATTATVWAVFIWALSLPVPILPFLK